METLQIAFVVPASGPAGLFGPGCDACGDLAAAELNAAGGILGREVRLRPVDGGRSPAEVAAEVGGLVDAGEVDAVTGWHISAVRQQIAPRLRGRIPYVYSPLYEGGERTPGVFLAGETPDRQVLPALRWMARELGVRTWCLVGDDYVWPRVSANAVHRWVRGSDVRILDEVFVPLGTEDFGDALTRVERSGTAGVLMFLVGADAVRFNRAFAAAGLDAVRLSPLMEENMLLASGPSDGLYAASAFFESLPTASGLDFSRRYAQRFGPRAPVPGALAESCYEGLTLLGRLAERARSLDPADMAGAGEGATFESPRGDVRLLHNHLQQDVYLARADGLEFDVLARLT